MHTLLPPCTLCSLLLLLLQLSAVSPKKTVEGAVGGLLCSIGVALGLYKVRAACGGRQAQELIAGGPCGGSGL